MKKLINAPETVLADALAGFAAAHPELTVDQENRVITRSGRPATPKVALISGGGSGHEPLHGGFVGPGMLDAACPGEVFTSPVPDQLLAAAQAVHSGAGVVFVVKNYTGDVMNFELAAELAADEGIEVRTVLVNDDVAVEDSTWTAGRRGTGATVLVEKIAGALAERGADLDRVAALGDRVNAASRSFAIALTAATVPAAGKPGFDLPENEIEVGVGIHGEPGRRREPLRPAAELAAEVVDTILADHHLSAGDEVIALLNGLGGTPLIELYVLYGAVADRLAGQGIRIARNLVGNYVTSLDMAGFSLTLTKADPELLELWDAPVATPALRWS
ncbi:MULTISPECIES: dihydroxyacetone kinase subunit DhaK [unclassified Kitasatospora]|uniref:dihydroxyacetone kinase subunit DhaK n=1 Tax=unclassified Kitasatospora TaxID=2633591 RepID=UPI00070DBBEF|nr:MULTISPECIES: dihydroxyacetone kinase subunit DhaK [unclassified Kitasatospora]KQV20609.1 dihydroxyacetone kinase [Kitasatospora sp. Root107]KRB69061.1 dihydroxyacetone kinase [Kitasatospora sp. Root187]